MTDCSMMSIDELLQGIQDGQHSYIPHFYELFKTEELKETDAGNEKPIHDLFEVDLSVLPDEALYTLHQFTPWTAPSAALVERFSTRCKDLDDGTLNLLLQCQCEEAKHELFNRYQDDLASATDEVLVVMTQTEGHPKSQEAYETLMIRYQKPVKKIIQSLEKKYFLRGYDTDDMVQEGLIGLVKAKDDYKIERKTKFKDFSRHVIKKYIGTLILRSSNNKNKVLNESFSYHSPINGQGNDVTFEHLLKREGYLPEENYINKESFNAIWSKLTKLEREVLQFRELGYTYDEIAHKVGKGRKAIDNTIQRIRKKGKLYMKFGEWYPGIEEELTGTELTTTETNGKYTSVDIIS